MEQESSLGDLSLLICFGGDSIMPSRRDNDQRLFYITFASLSLHFFAVWNTGDTSRHNVFIIGVLRGLRAPVLFLCSHVPFSRNMTSASQELHYLAFPLGQLTCGDDVFGSCSRNTGSIPIRTKMCFIYSTAVAIASPDNHSAAFSHNWELRYSALKRPIHGLCNPSFITSLPTPQHPSACTASMVKPPAPYAVANNHVNNAFLLINAPS